MWEGTERIRVDARPEAVWAVVTDVARHPELAGSGEVLAIRMEGPLGVGSGWEADESIKMMGAFKARSECLVFDPPREFAWKSVPPPIKKDRADSVPDVTWRFLLQEDGDGTVLEHSFRVVEPKSGGLMMKVFYLLTRRASTIRKGMRKTMQNVKAAVEQQAPATAEPAT